MRTVLAATLLASLSALALLSTGCDAPFGCGGYSGGNDRVLARGQDALILCENGGFVATLQSGNLEGRYATDDFNSNITHGTLTDTAAIAFTLTEATDGTSSAPELGAGTWTDVDLDTVALDHANTQCLNLQSEAWWSAAAPQ